MTQANRRKPRTRFKFLKPSWCLPDLFSFAIADFKCEVIGKKRVVDYKS